MIQITSQPFAHLRTNLVRKPLSFGNSDVEQLSTTQLCFQILKSYSDGVKNIPTSNSYQRSQMLARELLRRIQPGMAEAQQGSVRLTLRAWRVTDTELFRVLERLSEEGKHPVRLDLLLAELKKQARANGSYFRLMTHLQRFWDEGWIKFQGTSLRKDPVNWIKEQWLEYYFKNIIGPKLILNGIMKSIRLVHPADIDAVATMAVTNTQQELWDNELFPKLAPLTYVVLTPKGLEELGRLVATGPPPVS